MPPYLYRMTVVCLFVQADCPDVSRIPKEDSLGVTVVLLTCSYRGNEFVRVGYYVNNEYSDPEMNENPPSTPQYGKVCMQVCMLWYICMFLETMMRK